MGALVTRALRPIRSFNIENRAHRVISKEKPDPAPSYPHALEDLKRTLQVVPDIDEKLDKKDPELDNRLKDVYVTSHGKPEDDITRERKEQSSTRILPQDRKAVEEFEMGFKEPDRVKYGKTTLRHAITFIGAHQTNPKDITPTKIALEYKLKEDDVQDILKYFKTFEVYIPKTKKTPAIFAGPATTRKQLEELNAKELESKEGAENRREKKENQAKVVAARNGSIGAASVGAASLGARRDAPTPKRAPSVHSDERSMATQGDLLNSIKFQRRYLNSFISEKLSGLVQDKISATSKDRFSIKDGDSGIRGNHQYYDASATSKDRISTRDGNAGNRGHHKYYDVSAISKERINVKDGSTGTGNRESNQFYDVSDSRDRSRTTTTSRSGFGPQRPSSPKARRNSRTMYY